MQKKSFTKVKTTDGLEHYVLATIKEGGKDGVVLAITDGKSAWKGEVSGDELTAKNQKGKMKQDEYLEQISKALTGHDLGGLTFVYELKKSPRFTEFSWKRKEKDIKIELGSVRLTACTDVCDVLKDMFDHSIQFSEASTEEIRTLQATTERLSTERTNALKKLEKCVTAKEELEKDLYSKFQLIMNSKKTKLRQLKGELDAVRGSSDTEQNEGRSGRSDTFPEPSRSTDHLSDDDEESDFDSDGSSNPPPVKKGRRNALVPTDDSRPLLFRGEDEDDEKKGAAVARRPRKLAGSQKQKTPAKPVIPKVSSGRKTRLSKGSSSGSGASGRSARHSASQPDADELMECM